jgi:DNA mismatch repair ATPase MutS
MKQKSDTPKKSTIEILHQRLKFRHKAQIVLFGIDDQYQAIAEDAVTVSNILGTVLTQKEYEGRLQSMTGFDRIAIDHNISKLGRAGYTVAICDIL